MGSFFSSLVPQGFSAPPPAEGHITVVINSQTPTLLELSYGPSTTMDDIRCLVLEQCAAQAVKKSKKAVAACDFHLRATINGGGGIMVSTLVQPNALISSLVKSGMVNLQAWPASPQLIAFAGVSAPPVAASGDNLEKIERMIGNMSRRVEDIMSRRVEDMKADMSRRVEDMSRKVEDIKENIRAEQTGLSDKLSLIARAQVEQRGNAADPWTESMVTPSDIRDPTYQRSWKDELVKYYGVKTRRVPTKDGSVEVQLQSMLTWKWYRFDRITAGHIFPFKTHGVGMEQFGLQGSLWSERNGLLWENKADQAFGAKKVCFLYNPMKQHFTFKVLDPSLFSMVISDYESSDGKNITFHEVDGMVTKLPAVGERIPFRRLLSHHAQHSFSDALKRGWISQEEFDSFQSYDRLSEKVLSEGGADWLTDQLRQIAEGTQEEPKKKDDKKEKKKKKGKEKRTPKE